MKELTFKSAGMVKVSPTLSYNYEYTGSNGVSYIGNPEFFVEATKTRSLMIPIDIEHQSMFQSNWNTPIGFILTNSLVVEEDGVYGEMFVTTEELLTSFTGLSPVYNTVESESGARLVKSFDSIAFTENENFCELSYAKTESEKFMCYNSAVTKKKN